MKRHFGTGVLVGFALLFVLAVRFCLQVGIASSEYAPDDFRDLERHARAFAFSLLLFSAAGLGSAVAAFRGKPWGPLALAWLVSCAAVATAACRLVMRPRWVIDPDWPLVLVLTAFAVLSWKWARAAPTLK